MQIPGFLNTGLPGKRSCDALRYNSSVGVQKSFYLTDDIRQIAMTLDSHPIVDYPDDVMNDPNMKVTDIVEQSWARLSGSSVWLPEQGVYLSVTRIIFCPTRTRSVPKMSFLRGQVFNQDWEPLNNHNLTWDGKVFNFPLVFDIPAQWEQDGNLYGPEDPRIILEDGVEGAEPVVIFNMIGKRSDWKRAMYILRPFSNHTTILTIKDTERQWTEKNWAPFFVPYHQPAKHASKGEKALLSNKDVATPRVDNEYIHFIYSFKPLQILKCHLRCGDCEFVYEQVVPENFHSKHREDGGSLRGGTNFVPVPIPKQMRVDPRVQVYAAFPRTNIEQHCSGSFYRPEFVVMVMIGDQFHLAFASESLDFGNAIIELAPEDDRCDKGRILIPNSIAQWDTSNGQDVMSVTFSVNDETVQVARVEGILEFVHRMPQFQNLLSLDGPLKGADTDLMNMLSSWVGDDLRGCLVEAALNYTEAAQELTHPHDDDLDLDPSKELLRKIHQEQDELEELEAYELSEEGNLFKTPETTDDAEGIPDLDGADGDELDAFEDMDGEPITKGDAKKDKDGKKDGKKNNDEDEKKKDGLLAKEKEENGEAQGDVEGDVELELEGEGEGEGEDAADDKARPKRDSHLNRHSHQRRSMMHS
ncbi:hypothetical protein LTR84_005651 [Exophiala bonariae]|uniref:C2H2-type domain-containing protein n=1 Tax=Exophiala bonariae TaxID=1690606 RepID=A0AAV9N706_9EURO|nr:hypothetical protein LTR84_005651 [Exophiala bonariae]